MLLYYLIYKPFIYINYYYFINVYNIKVFTFEYNIVIKLKRAM